MRIFIYPLIKSTGNWNLYIVIHELTRDDLVGCSFLQVFVGPLLLYNPVNCSIKVFTGNSTATLLALKILLLLNDHIKFSDLVWIIRGHSLSQETWNLVQVANLTTSFILPTVPHHIGTLSRSLYDAGKRTFIIIWTFIVTV